MHAAADDDNVIVKTHPERHVLVLTSKRLLHTAADDDNIKCQNALCKDESLCY